MLERMRKRGIKENEVYRERGNVRARNRKMARKR